MSTPSLAQLKRAIVISEQIEKLQSELAGLFGGQGAPGKTATPKSTKKGKRTMSPEARERIASAQRARWAKSKGVKPAPAAKMEKPVRASKAAAKPKANRVISSEARANMAEAAKKRWAANKAAK